MCIRDSIQLLTPRDLSKLAIGQCKYVLIVNEQGGILNDPVLLRLGENHFWLSLSDSDILFLLFRLATHIAGYEFYQFEMGK